MTGRLEYLPWKWDRNYLAELRRPLPCSHQVCKMPGPRRAPVQLRLGHMATPGPAHGREREGLVEQVSRDPSTLWSGRTDRPIYHPTRRWKDNALKGNQRPEDHKMRVNIFPGFLGLCPRCFLFSTLLPGPSHSLTYWLQLHWYANYSQYRPV